MNYIKGILDTGTSWLSPFLSKNYCTSSIMGTAGVLILYHYYSSKRKKLTVDNCFYLKCLQDQFIKPYKDAIRMNGSRFRIQTIVLAIGDGVAPTIEKQISQYLYDNMKYDQDFEDGDDIGGWTDDPIYHSLKVYTIPLENLEFYDIYSTQSFKSSIDVVITIESPTNTSNFASLLKKFSTISVLLKKSSLFISFFNHLSQNADQTISWNNLSLEEINNMYKMCGYNVVNSIQHNSAGRGPLTNELLSKPNEGNLTLISSISPDWDVNSKDEISFEVFEEPNANI